MSPIRRKHRPLRESALATAVAVGAIYAAADARSAAEEIDPFALSPEERFDATVSRQMQRPTAR